MKNLHITVLLVVVFSMEAGAQWNGATNVSDPIFRTGNVGIGTGVSPLTQLLVRVSTAVQGLVISNVDNIGSQSHFALTTADQARLGLAAESYLNIYNYGMWIFNSGKSAGGPVLPISFHTSDISRIFIKADGNIGIGTTSPRGKFDVDGPGDIYLSDDPIAGATQNLFLPGHIYISPYAGSNVSYLQARRSDNSGTTALRFRTYNNGVMTDAMHIAGDGNVGIGTASPTQKLTVKGTIYGKEVQVDLNVPGPDYVFEKDYKLPSLEEIKSYIGENKHLPEVPSAKEMEANGINVGEMNMILLKKVEELTLYLIEQEKKIEKLQLYIKSTDDK